MNSVFYGINKKEYVYFRFEQQIMRYVNDVKTNTYSNSSIKILIREVENLFYSEDVNKLRFYNRVLQFKGTFVIDNFSIPEDFNLEIGNKLLIKGCNATITDKRYDIENNTMIYYTDYQIIEEVSEEEIKEIWESEIDSLKSHLRAVGCDLEGLYKRSGLLDSNSYYSKKYHGKFIAWLFKKSK